MKTLGVTRLGAFAVLFCAQLTSALAITFTHDAFISFADLSKDGQDIAVSNCTLTVDGPHTFTTLQVLNGGVLTHSPFPYGPQQLTFFVSGETQVLSTTNPAVLNNTNVDTDSIQVLSSGGSILYTENVDYFLTVSNEFILLNLTTNSTIADGATVQVDYDWAQTFQGFNLNITGSAQVLPGGAINLSGKGYAGGIAVAGGAVSLPTNYPFAFTAAGGAGHGGAGGMSSTFAHGGATYDSTTNPAALGSGGGTGSGVGGGGGGAATLLVAGEFQIDGQILAGGLKGTNAHSGGGAGGSVFISAGSLTGAGLISANGGSGNTPDGGGGGGGRIAIYSPLNSFAGSITAFGGGGSTAGGAGTIYVQSDTNAVGKLFIVNTGKRGTNTTFSAAVSDLTIAGGAVLQAPAVLWVTNLFVGSNSWLMSPDLMPFTVNVTGDATVEPNAVINADFRSSFGSGAGSASCGAGSGGSYGGYGGASVCGTRSGLVYGTISTPAQMGSPGASASLGRAGGAIRMIVAGTLSLGGKISANGAAAVATTSGGGSGGSVWLTAGTLSGVGAISANGGSASNFVSGAGGGGRVAVYSDTNLFTGSITARGGVATNSGGPGSVYVKTGSEGIPQIIFDNGGLVGNTYVSAVFDKSDLTISGGTVLTNSQSTPFTLRSLFIGSNSWLMTLPYPSAGVSGTATNVTIQSGGGILSDGTWTSTFPGAGQSVNSIGGGGGGAGLGGTGGTNAAGGVQTVAYSVATSPGGVGGAGGGFGGGGINLAVPGKLQLDGRISANGAPGISFNSGGGGGGSVRLSARTISGTGIISANGGAGNNLGGGGAGGAIAFYVDTNLFSGVIHAFGGSGFNFGGAGTEYFSQFAFAKTFSQLIVDNGGNRGAKTLITSSTDISDLTVTGGAVVSNTVVILAQLRNLLVGTNSALQVYSSVTTTLTITSNATVQAGGSLNVDALNFTGGNGFGQSLNLTGGGGGNAGTGGASLAGAAGGPAFSDSITSPALPGGRGGAGANQGAGGNGGGVLRLTVNGTLRVDGRISADGGTTTNLNSGGGAGGGIMLSPKVLSGTGVISANGAPGNSAGGGGGGGHISIVLTSNSFAGTLTARGGIGGNAGGAGVIYVSPSPTINVPPAELIVDNGGLQGANTTFSSTLQGTFNLTIKGGALLTSTVSPAIQNLLVGSNSMWLLPSTALTVTSNAIVQASGVLASDGQAVNGPSPGQNFASQGGGGGHGGYGGASISNALGGGVSLDSISSPTASGSVGGLSGGTGGGALQVTVRGTLQLDGRLSANGVTSPSSVNSGGGSGGAIVLRAARLIGSGSILADGGAANNLGGGGAGGRLAIWSRTNLFTGTVAARGGAGANYGGAGTIFLNPDMNDLRPGARLIVDNGGAHGTNTALVSTINSVDVVVTNGATLTVAMSGTPTWNNVTISSNSSLTVATNFTPLHLQINSNLDIQTGGALIVDRLGSPANGGAGHGLSISGSGAGAGHGGVGSWAGKTEFVGGMSFLGGISYDSIIFPNLAGSGGGSSASTSGSAGGGAAQVAVNGECKINGVISANGGDANTSGAGGGSGGSVWLTAGLLSGSGKITADGGSGDTFTSGGGAGGRIAVYFNTNLFAGTFSAHGGAGVGLSGGAGTIYLKKNSASVAQLIVDNGGLSGTTTPIGSSPQVDLLVRNGGAAESAQTLNLQSLLIASNSKFVALSVGSVNLAVTGDATVETNGAILADATGFGAGSGTGSGSVDYFGDGSGGGYGGAGGASFFGAPGGITYGSSNQPAVYGSPGGILPTIPGYSQGGGLIRLTVNGAFTVNGNISANGADGFVDGSGGGSGGSIWITAQKLSGNGSFSANGGWGEAFEGGGGGGGRIAIYANSNSFTGTISAIGGEGAAPGQDGTIYAPTSLLISGMVTNSIGAAVSGITLQPSGLTSVISDTNGNYSVTVPPLWTGSIVPAGDTIIVPSVRNFTNLTVDVPNQNFLVTSPAAPFYASGTAFAENYMTIRWFGVSGSLYQLQSSSNLVDWVPYGPIRTGFDGPMTDVVPTTDAPQLYFRVSVFH
jgi:hypothetical protein